MMTDAIDIGLSREATPALEAIAARQARPPKCILDEITASRMPPFYRRAPAASQCLIAANVAFVDFAPGHFFQKRRFMPRRASFRSQYFTLRSAFYILIACRLHAMGVWIYRTRTSLVVIGAVFVDTLGRCASRF